MSIPQPADNDKFGFVPINKQVETSSSKVVELRQQKQESTDYYVSCLLAAEAIDYWLKPKPYPLSRQQALKLLGIQGEVKEFDDDDSELKLIKFLEKQKAKKYKILAKYGETIALLDDVKKSGSYRVGSLKNELKLKLEKLYDDYPVEIDVVEEVTEYFDSMEKYLDDWYASESKYLNFIPLVKRLKHNALRLKNRLHTRLEDIISYGQNSSLKGSLNFLEELSSTFQELKQEYAKESARYIEKEQGCLRTYQRSLSALKVREDGDADGGLEQLLYGVYKTFKLKEKLPYYQELMESFRIAKNNLLNLYTYKIEAEAYSQAIQIIQRIEATNQIYIDRLKSSEEFLIEMRDGFLAEIKMRKDNILVPFMLEDITNHLNPKLLLRAVEEKIGHTLSTWGSYRGVDKDMVKTSLLSELDQIAQKICDSTKERLNKESK